MGRLPPTAKQCTKIYSTIFWYRAPAGCPHQVSKCLLSVDQWSTLRVFQTLLLLLREDSVTTHIRRGLQQKVTRVLQQEICFIKSNNWLKCFPSSLQFHTDGLNSLQMLYDSFFTMHSGWVCRVCLFLTCLTAMDLKWKSGKLCLDRETHLENTKMYGLRRTEEGMHQNSICLWTIDICLLIVSCFVKAKQTKKGNFMSQNKHLICCCVWHVTDGCSSWGKHASSDWSEWWCHVDYLTSLKDAFPNAHQKIVYYCTCHIYVFV